MTVAVDFVEDRLGEWVEFRRDLHRHPELGFTEYRTQARIAERLEALGYRLRLGCEVMREQEMLGLPPSPALADAREAAVASGARSDLVRRMGDGMTGLVAELSSGKGPVIAMRFDVDALPLGEARNERHRPHRLGFASKYDGRMHASGHDGHATIGLGLAEIAAREPRSWSGTLRLMFQPAEEGGRGAWPMVAAGVVDDVDLFLALHLGCDLSSRKVAQGCEMTLREMGRTIAEASSAKAMDLVR